MNTAANILKTADGDFEDELKPGFTLLQGQYTIEKYLNSGGFAMTYLARDSLDRVVVIKECFPDSFCRRSKAVVQARSRAHQGEFRSIVKLFVQEARSLAKLSHPNIVGVHQVFEDNSTAYMALDYIQGRDLLDTLEDKANGLRPAGVKNILVQILGAVKYLHDQNILHRDISPDNILINNALVPILIDFGAAREQASKVGKVMSTLRVVKDGYSPQEFYIAGTEQGPSSDLYALGATFYHLITGVIPPDSQLRLSAMASREDDPYEPLLGKVSDYDDDFLAAIDKSLLVMPKERLQSASEWLDIIEGRASLASAQPAKTAPAAVTELEQQAEQKTAPKSVTPARVKSAERFEDIGLADTPEKKNLALKLILASVPVIAIIGYAVVVQTAAPVADPVETATVQPEVITPVIPSVPVTGPKNEPVQLANIEPEFSEFAPTVFIDLPQDLPFIIDGDAFLLNSLNPTVVVQESARPGALVQTASLGPVPTPATEAGPDILTGPIDFASIEPFVEIIRRFVETEWSITFPFIPSESAFIAIALPLAGAETWMTSGLIINTVNGKEVSSMSDIQRIVRNSVDLDTVTDVAVTFGVSKSIGGTITEYDTSLKFTQLSKLADGTTFRTTYTDGIWSSVVTAKPDISLGNLKIDDVLVAYIDTQEPISGRNTVSEILDREFNDGKESLRFIVDRNGSNRFATIDESQVGKIEQVALINENAGE